MARPGGVHEPLTGPVNTSRRSLGTLAWARHTGGRLSRSNQLKLLMEAALRRGGRIRYREVPGETRRSGSLTVQNERAAAVADRQVVMQADSVGEFQCSNVLRAWPRS